jgi:hypothetical protein
MDKGYHSQAKSLQKHFTSRKLLRHENRSYEVFKIGSDIMNGSEFIRVHQDRLSTIHFAKTKL